MEAFLLQTYDYHQHYTCNYTVDSVPFASRQRIILPAFFIAIGTIEFFLYIPCLIVIYNKIERSSFKFMFVMGLLDLPALLITAIFTGIFSALGWVYCSAPNFIYVSGAAAFALWIAETSVEALLAVNRCITIGSPRLYDLFFEGWRTWFWMIPPGLYGIYFFLYEKTILFSGIEFNWLFYPAEGYIPMTQADIEYFRSNIYSIHNWILAFTLCSVYTIIVYQSGAFRRFIHLLSICGICDAPTSTVSAPPNANNRDNQILIQVILISLINTLCVSMYICVDSGYTSEFFNISSLFLWTQSHGIPPIIYLTLNQTIRTECKKIALATINCFKCCKTQPQTMFISSTEINTIKVLSNARKSVVVINRRSINVGKI